MSFVSSALMFIGYLLVYAAVADSGKYATQPWKGVLGDAYTDTGPQTPGPSGPNIPQGPGPGQKRQPAKPLPGVPAIPIPGLGGTLPSP